jgi:hypothetical protein
LAKDKREELVDAKLSLGINIVGIAKGLGIFNVVGLNEADGFIDKSFAWGNGMEGSNTGLFVLGGRKEEFFSISEGNNSCLTSCDVGGRLMVIVGNAGGTRINGSGSP